MRDFIDFLRKRAVAGLAVGFMLGGAVSKLTTALVDDIINPLLGLAVDTANLRDKAFLVGDAQLLWGDLLAAFVDFMVIALVVYAGFKLLRLDRDSA
jgi:large conductance mechanosensitive channel